MEKGQKEYIANMKRLGVFELRPLSETVGYKIVDGKRNENQKPDGWRCRCASREHRAWYPTRDDVQTPGSADKFLGSGLPSQKQSWKKTDYFTPAWKTGEGVDADTLMVNKQVGSFGARTLVGGISPCGLSRAP